MKREYWPGRENIYTEYWMEGVSADSIAKLGGLQNLCDETSEGTYVLVPSSSEHLERTVIERLHLLTGVEPFCSEGL